MYGIKIQLPSRGKYGKTSVNIRRPKVDDLMDFFQSGNNSVIAKNQLIKQLCDTDIGKYPTGDREFIFVNIRSLVNSNTIAGAIPCTNERCGQTVAYMVDLSKCRVNQLPDDFQKDYEFTFPNSGEKKVFNLLTVEREELLEDYIRLYESADLKLANSDLGENLHEFARYACMLGDSNNVADVDRNVTFLRELPWGDFEKLMLYDIAFDCGPDISAETMCDDCKKKYRIRIKTDSSFFGISLEGLISRHRFLAKASNIGFSDFLKYTVPVMHTVTEGEVQRVREQNAKIKAARGKRRR